MANLTKEQQKLWNAIVERDFAKLNDLLEQGVSPDFTNEHGVTPMMALAAQEWSETITMRRLVELDMWQKYENIAANLISHVPENRRRAYINTVARIGNHSEATLETVVDICGYESGVGKIAAENGGKMASVVELQREEQPEVLQSHIRNRTKEEAKSATVHSRYGSDMDKMSFEQEKRPDDDVEVFKGVTIGELRSVGYSDEKIHQMQDMVRNKVQSYLAEKGELVEHLGQHAQPVQLTMEDYQSIGLDRNDALQISILAQNDDSIR